MFSELVDYYKLHGHCNVPDDWTVLRERRIEPGAERQRYHDK